MRMASRLIACRVPHHKKTSLWRLVPPRELPADAPTSGSTPACLPWANYRVFSPAGRPLRLLLRLLLGLGRTRPALLCPRLALLLLLHPPHEMRVSPAGRPLRLLLRLLLGLGRTHPTLLCPRLALLLLLRPPHEMRTRVSWPH